MRRALFTGSTGRFESYPPGVGPLAGTPYYHGSTPDVLAFPARLSGSAAGPTATTGLCGIDVPTMPDPVTGMLYAKIDPGIKLIAEKFGLQLDFTYGSSQTDNAQFGANRTASVNARIYSQTSGGKVSVVGGDFSVQEFVPSGGGYAPSGNTAAWTSLTYDSVGNAFTQYFNDGMRMVFKPMTGTSGNPVTHQLFQVVNASNVSQTYNYETNPADPEYGLLQSITVPGGRNVSFLYGASTGPTSLLSAVQDWSGRLFSFQYDSNQNLTTFISPLGCATGYSYTDVCGATLLNAVTDSRGYSTKYNWNSSGQVVGTEQGDALWNFNYQPANNRNVMVSPAGARTTHMLSPDNKMVSSTYWPEGFQSSFVYDSTSSVKTQEQTALGNVYNVSLDSMFRINEWTDILGNLYTATFDAYSNLVSMVDANGAITTNQFAGTGSTMQRTTLINALGQTTTFANSTDGLVLSQTDPRGLTTNHQYDSYGNRVSTTFSDGGMMQWQHDSLNRPTTTVNQLGYTSSQSWDAGDNMIGRTDNTGASWQYVYDNCLLQATVSPLGFRTTNSYGRFSTPVSVINARGFVTTNVLDSMGYPIARIDADGFAATTVFNAAKQVVNRIDQAGYVTTNLWDSYNRQIGTINANGFLSQTVYNARNDVVSAIDEVQNVTQYYYDNVGRRTTALNALGQTNATVFDLLGRPVTQINGLNQQTNMYYDPAGNLTTTVDANGHGFVSIMAANSNRVTATVDGNSLRVSLTWDLAGGLTAVQNGRGYRTTMTLDGNGRQVSLVNAQNQMTQWFYDLDGRNTTQIDANGHVKTQTFDSVSNLVSVIWADGKRCTTLYDSLDQPSAVIDWTGVTSIAWDQRNKLFLRYDPTGLELEWSYDGVGNRNAIGITDGTNSYGTQWFYDPANRLVSILNGNLETTTFTLDALGREIGKQTANGWIVNQVFDAAGNVTYRSTSAGCEGPVLAAYAANYDAVGNRLGVSWHDGTRQSFQYDNTYQITDETCAGTFNYSNTYLYDPAGNRVSLLNALGTTNYSYTAADELVLITPPSGPPTTQMFDSNGNLTTQVTGTAITTNIWDDENRLINYYLADGTIATNIYGCDGKRRSADSWWPTGSSSQTFTWDNDNIYRFDVDGQLTAYATNYPGYWGGLTSIDVPGSNSTDASIFYAFDMQGNAVLQSQLGGGPLQQQAYTVFGQQLLPFNGAGFQFGAKWGYFTDLATLIMLMDTPYDPLTGEPLRRLPAEVAYPESYTSFVLTAASQTPDFVGPESLLLSAGNPLKPPAKKPPFRVPFPIPKTLSQCLANCVTQFHNAFNNCDADYKKCIAPFPNNQALKDVCAIGRIQCQGQAADIQRDCARACDSKFGPKPGPLPPHFCTVDISLPSATVSD